MSLHTPTRRAFFQSITASGAFIWVGPAVAQNSMSKPPSIESASPGDLPPPENLAAKGEIPRRKFGKTDVIVSALALGGHTFATAKSEKEAVQIVQEAVDHGLTFMDNAWDYHQGKSEELMGKALEGRRDKVFLMTKACSHGRDKKTAMEQLEQSLRRLRTDHLDLWQIHEVVYENDPELHNAKGGAVEALAEAKKQGKVRFVGFTGHKDPDIHLKMLGFGFPYDAVQMPLNGFDANFRSFEREVLPVLSERGIAPIGMKSLNGQPAPAVLKNVIAPEEALRYAMSLPVTTTVSGIDSLEILRKNIKIAQNFVPMTVEEKDAYRRKCALYAADGRFELYKTSIQFDGDEGRRQHGYPSPSTVQA